MSQSHLNRNRGLPCNVRAFIVELEDRFGCTFHSPAPNLFAAELAHPAARVEIDPQNGVLRLSTPLRGAELGLSADMAFCLLIRRFPQEALSGAGVRESLDEGLEIFREASLQVLSPAGVAVYVRDHAQGAQSFDHWLRDQRPSPPPAPPTSMLEMADA